MIYYSKQWWGLVQLMRFYGSALPRAVPFALVSGLLTLAFELPIGKRTLQFWFSGNADQLARNPVPYPFQVFAFMVGFILVFRSTFAYRRFWEGRTNLAQMEAMFLETVTLVLNFDRGSLPMDISKEDAMMHGRFNDAFLHYMSLLHAVALQSLRKDFDMSNLLPHMDMAGSPPCDAADLWKAERKAKGISGFHAHFSFWDLIFLRSSRKVRLAYNRIMPLTVVSGVSNDEKVLLGRLPFERGMGVSRGFKISSGEYVPGPGERVGVVLAWVNQLLLERRREGGINVPAPLVTRIYQVLSNGMLGYEQSRKIQDTPFPFPLAQFSTTVLLVFSFMLPIVSAAAIDNAAVAAITTFVSVLTHYSLNELARDLEDPFLYDPNDLPLAHNQWKYNEKLLALSQTLRPISSTEKALVRLRTFREEMMAVAMPPATERSRREDGGGVIGGRSFVLDDVLSLQAETEPSSSTSNAHPPATVKSPRGLGSMLGSLGSGSRKGRSARGLAAVPEMETQLSKEMSNPLLQEPPASRHRLDPDGRARLRNSEGPQADVGPRSPGAPVEGEAVSPVGMQSQIGVASPVSREDRGPESPVSLTSPPPAAVEASPTSGFADEGSGDGFRLVRRAQR